MKTHIGEGSGEPFGSPVSEDREAEGRPPETEGVWGAVLARVAEGDIQNNSRVPRPNFV